MIKIDKAVVTDLASCVVWALKFLKVPSGAGMWCKMVPGEPIVTMPWQEKFMRALDGVGVVTDRKAYWKQKDAPKKKRTARVPRRSIRAEGFPS